MAAGTPRSAKNATSVQPNFAVTGTAPALARAASKGWRSDGGAAGALSTTWNVSPSSTHGANISVRAAAAELGPRSGAKR